MAPRTLEQNELVREESRTRIIEASLSLFARDGYEGTTIRSIAREAGVSQGLLYNYFAGKEDLVRAILAQGMADVLQSFEEALVADVGEVGPVERLLRSSIAILRRNRRFWLLLYSIRSQPAVIERLAPEIGELAGRIESGLEAIARAAGARDPATEARVLFAVVDGISQQFVLDPEGYPIDAVISRVVRLFGETTP